ncbi:MAG: tRNA guanosine(34) transglycosylase Tgt [bacterium]|nr:tRNA guanosine(34) transglycosylase Tgt [bacterium]
MFNIIKKDPESWARVGRLETPHGVIETPAYTIVGTHGEVKCLPREMLAPAKVQVIITNTYHLWLAALERSRSGQDNPPKFRDEKLGGPVNALENLPRVHDLFGQNIPLMTDSGGFQVFSLGFGREHGVGKVNNNLPPPQADSAEKNLVRITEEGVFFTTAKGEEFLGPELSMRIQEKLGADIILAFDDFASPLKDHAYTAQAMERTHRWAKICLDQKSSHQLLYGIVQGGEFQDLRIASAKFINSLPFDGLAIGGSLGKSESGAFDVLKWTIPLLSEDRPRHFLGIGKIEDLFEGVALGIDTFDCVIPTREARHAKIWTGQGSYDITKAIYKVDSTPLERDCLCPTCLKITRQELHALFKAKDQTAGQYATVHNVYFFNHLMEQIRVSIQENNFQKFKKEFLAKRTLLR